MNVSKSHIVIAITKPPTTTMTGITTHHHISGSLMRHHCTADAFYDNSTLPVPEALHNVENFGLNCILFQMPTVI